MTRYIKLFITILVVISIITHVTVVDAKNKNKPKKPKKTIDEKMDVKKDMERKAGKAGKECFEDTSKNEAQKKKCSLDKTKEETEKLKGENITDTEAEEMLLQAGKDRAAAVIKNCTRDANNPNAKKSCFTGSAAKEACKEYNGGDDCSNTQIMEGIKDLTVKDVQDKVSSCTKSKTTRAEKENCRKNKQKELKKDIADSLGKGKENIKDSEVQEVIKKGATKAIMNTIGLCNSTDVVDRKRCAKDGKKAMADSLGKDKDDISD